MISLVLLLCMNSVQISLGVVNLRICTTHPGGLSKLLQPI